NLMSYKSYRSYLISIKQVRPTPLGEFFLPGPPRSGYVSDGNPAFNLPAQFRSPRDHVERQTVVDVFIRRRLPTEIARVEVVKGLDQRDPGAHWFESFSVEGVNLNSVATASGVFLKCRQKAVRAETDGGKIGSVEILGHPI